MKGTVHIVNPEREETVLQNQIAGQATQINITNNPARNSTYIERYPQMKFIREPKYQIRANFRPEVTQIETKLAEAVKEAVWDCQRSSTYTQAAFESSMKKHLESVPKVTVITYGIIQKIDQFGNPWQDWMDGKESFELLQQSLLKIPLKQGTADVQYVPLETEKEAEEPEEEKPLWERAWNKLKETASDVWDTVTSEEFREKALAIGGTILVATAATAAVIATAGAAGPAMGAVVTYLGGSAALAGAATTATTVGGYVIAGAVVADAVNTSVEVATGTNLIAKGAYELLGNENWTEQDFLNLYREGRELLYMGAYGYAEFGANAMAAGYSSQKSVESSVTKWKTIGTQSADNVNKTFPKEYEPPYKPGTQTKVIELTQNTKPGEFVRVYDNVNSGQAGGWIMKGEDIAGLTPQEIQNKFALPAIPTHVTDVGLKAGTQLRTGIANGLFGYEGGGLQFDMMGQRVGEFSNGRLLH